MLESLRRGYFCNSCGRAFDFDSDGNAIGHVTNHTRPFQADVSGHEIDGD